MKKRGLAKNRLNLVGKRFGRLLVTRDAGNRIRPCGDKESIWECLCDCGNTKVITGSNLQTGDTLSCGCFNVERIVETKTIPEKEYRINRVMGTYKRAAALKGLPFELSRELFHTLITSECHYCGSEPNNCHRPHGKDIIYQGIDRLDNSKGYTTDNVVPCCIVCNKMKKAMNVTDFVTHVHTISGRHECVSPQADLYYESPAEFSVL